MSQARRLTRIDEQWDWADHGHCQALPDLFYNSEHEPKGVRRRKEAAAKCREHALVNSELYGVWGGMSEAERHREAGRTRTG